MVYIYLELVLFRYSDDDDGVFVYVIRVIGMNELCLEWPCLNCSDNE